MITQKQIDEAAAFLRQQQSVRPLAGIVLGTGLNDLVQHIDNKIVVPYEQVPHFPSSTVAFHKGQLIFGQVHDVPVVAMQGRFHYYEGYTMQQLTFPVRVFKELGITHLLLSNAAGGMNPTFKKGDLIITDDHLNLLPDNPLRGLGDEFGNRFVDMSQPYDPTLQKHFEQAFNQNGIAVKKGVYVSVMGPNLETRAEYRWLRSTGADMVGMSTVPEVIVANQLGIKCAAISVITDECDPDHLQPVNIAEIIEVAGQADKRLSAVFKEVLLHLKHTLN
ncbi:MAG TPA: purine-nucleoside phosphorylase [Flavisolibacter sp.]|nr:purine-nucleoside phosphorylase [Flavisolibacter sp.]